METEDRTMSFTAANLAALLLFIPTVAVILVPFELVHGLTLDFSVAGTLLFVLAMLVGVVIHEGLHGFGWGVLGGIGMGNVTYGIKQLTPYAHAKVPMDARSYRIGTLLPGFVLGVLPGIIALIIGWEWLALYGAAMFMAAGGDLLILWVLRDVGPAALVQDHPSEIGCIVHREKSETAGR